MLAWTAATDTLLPEVSVLLHVYLLLRSRGLVALETCLQSHSLTAAITFGSSILALSHHITVLPQHIFGGTEEPHLNFGQISNGSLFWLPNYGIEPSYHSIAPAFSWRDRGKPFES
jgi:hypothetical protein